MRLLRPILATAALLAAAATVPADARVTRPLELTQTTVITATHSGYVDLVLPVDARLSPAALRNPDVEVTGKGRYVGMWLNRVGEGLEANPDRLAVTRLPGFLGGKVETFGSTFPAATCTPVPNATVPVTQDCTDQPRAQAILLHEGKYRLLVLTDGSPVTFTLQLHGLDAGSTTVSPAHRVASAQQDLLQRETVQDKVVTFGGSVPVFPAFHRWVFAAVKGRAAGTLDHVSGCGRADQGPPPPYAFAPSCLGGDSGSHSTTLTANGTSYGHVAFYFGPSLTPGATTMSLGGSFAGDSGRAFVAGLGVWFAYSS